MIENNLAHGKVTIWTRGDDCVSSGKQSSRAKKLLTKNNIEFQENIIKDHSPEQ
jgi:glutaredoxin